MADLLLLALCAGEKDRPRCMRSVCEYAAGHGLGMRRVVEIVARDVAGGRDCRGQGGPSKVSKGGG